METIEYRTTDKSDWGPGPWQDEPDKIQYEDPATGLPCLVKRGGGGALCGYVGVSSDHPWFGKPYEDVAASVHGGLTFANKCSPGPEDRSICHLVEPGENDNVWWLGFDCNHCDDMAPEMEKTLKQIGHVWQGEAEDHRCYKPLAYVKAEVADLARQAAEAAKGGRRETSDRTCSAPR